MIKFGFLQVDRKKYFDWLHRCLAQSEAAAESRETGVDVGAEDGEDDEGEEAGDGDPDPAVVDNHVERRCA